MAVSGTSGFGVPGRCQTLGDHVRCTCDNCPTIPAANRQSGDPNLALLFEQYGGRLVTPGGAAALLGLSRQTIHTLCTRGQLRVYRSEEEVSRELPAWVYIPLDDIYAYGERVGRLVRRS
jgi:hypothetical protein